MIILTSYERQLRRHLIERARDPRLGEATARTTTYSQLFYLFPVANVGDSRPGNGQRWAYQLGDHLYRVSTYEHEHGRPLLTALVINKDGVAGAGFAKLARSLNREVGDDERQFWANELHRVVDFWSDDDPTRLLDALLDRMMNQRSWPKGEKSAITTT